MKKQKKCELPEKKCLDLLLENNSITKADYTFLKEDTILKKIGSVIVSLGTANVESITLEVDNKKININKITNTVKKEILELTEYNEYYKLNENPIVNNINYTLPKSKKIVKINMIDMFTKKGTVKVGNIEYDVENFEKIKKYIRTSTSKLFVFAIINLKSNTNISKFTLSDYAIFRNNTDKKELALKLKGDTNGNLGDLETLRKISNIKYSNRKNDRQTFKAIIYDYDYNRGKITIAFHPDFAESLKEYYMYLPKKLATINDNNYPHAWFLGYYIYEQARINKICTFELNIESCLERTSIPTYEEVKTTKRMYQKRIIEPFEKTIDILSETINDLEIEYKDNFKTIEQFLKGKIKIKITNENIQCNYDELANKRANKNIEKNKLLKNDRKNKATQLKNEGKNINEIAQTLNLTPKTIKNYLQ